MRALNVRAIVSVTRKSSGSIDENREGAYTADLNILFPFFFPDEERLETRIFNVRAQRM